MAVKSHCLRFDITAARAKERESERKRERKRDLERKRVRERERERTREKARERREKCVARVVLHNPYLPRVFFQWLCVYLVS